MGTFWVKDLVPKSQYLRPTELRWEPILFWLAFIVVWIGIGCLSHFYMLYSERKRRLLNQRDYNLVWTCIVVAPLALVIAFLMFITPDRD